MKDSYLCESRLAGIQVVRLIKVTRVEGEKPRRHRHAQCMARQELVANIVQLDVETKSVAPQLKVSKASKPHGAVREIYRSAPL